MYKRSLHLEHERSLKKALGANKAKLLSSGWVMVAETAKGLKRRIFINERKMEDFNAGVFSFTERFMDYPKDYDNALIAIVQEGDWSNIYLIDPKGKIDCGFTLLVTKDETGDKIFNYIKKIISMEHNIYDALGKVIGDAVSMAVATSVKPLMETITSLQSKLDAKENNSEQNQEPPSYDGWERVTRATFGENYKIH